MRAKRWLRVGFGKALLLMTAMAVSGGDGSGQTFSNPVIARGADPSVVLVDGMYYSVQSGCVHAGQTPVICIRASRSLAELGRTRPVPVWQAPAIGLNAHDVWAPEIEYLSGRWYIYYAADPDENPHHGLFALVPRDSQKPLGEWVEADTGSASGSLQLDWKSNWAIDPSVFSASDGKLYLLFACRQDNTDRGPGRFQSICIAQMSDPLHLAVNPLTGKKVVELALPDQAWEKRGFPTEEGPFGFTRNGVDYILYSASFSGTADQYAEGLLINTHPPQPQGRGNALLNPAAWVKEGPVFDGHHASYGTASTVLVRSPDQSELWQVYHGTDCLDGCTLVQNKTWADRSIRAQRAGWSVSGELVLGYPVDIQNTDGHGRPVALAAPSTGGGGSMNYPAWGAAFGDAAEGNPDDGLPRGDWTAAQPTSISLSSQDSGRIDRIFLAANPNFQNYVVYTKARLVAGAGGAEDRFGVVAAYVDRDNNFWAMVEPKGCGGNGCLSTQGVVQGKAGGWRSCPLPAGFDAAQANAIAVEVVNGTFSVLVNDVALEGACQNQHVQLDAGQVAANGSNGQVGVAGQGVRADFSSFMVSPGVPVDSKASGQLYGFRNLRTQMELDVECAQCRNEQERAAAPVIQAPAFAPYPLTGWPSQLWTLERKGDGFAIANSMTHLCLGASGDATTVAGRPCTEEVGQRWAVLPVDSRSSFVLRNEASGKVLEVADGQRRSAVKLSDRSDSPGQTWQLIVP